MCDGVHFPAMTRAEVAAVDFARECEAGTPLWTHSDSGRARECEAGTLLWTHNDLGRPCG